MVRSTAHVLGVVASLSGVLVLAGACGKITTGAGDCADGLSVSNGCAGVPRAAVCDSDTCTQGVACSTVLTASDQASLDAAIASATAGACIALKGGTYAAVTLPPGVSLLGTGAHATTVQGVKLAGAGSVVRGVAVGSGGVQVANGTTAARLESVLVSGSSGTGVSVGVGAELAIVTTSIEGAGASTGADDWGYGILASDSAKLTLDRVHVLKPKGPGVWMQACNDGCACSGAATLSAKGIIIEGAELVAMALAGVTATLDDVKLDGSVPFHKDGQQGAGLAAFQCSNLTATGLTITNNMYYGALIDHSSAKIGDAAAALPVTISGNQVHGIFIQNVAKMPDGTAQQVSLTAAKMTGNAGVALGLHASSGIIIEGCEASGTQQKTLPVVVDGLNPGQSTIGDGLSWTGGTQATIKSLTIDSNARTGAMIAGQWGDGSSANISLEKPGLLGGIIIEGIPTDGASMPGMDNVPASLITRDASFSQPFAKGPTAPLPIKTN